MLPATPQRTALTWVQGGATPFQLGFQWYNNLGQMLTFPPQLDFHSPLPADVPPDGTVIIQARLRTPDAPGVYPLRWDMIHEQVTWFTSQGDAGLVVSPITVVGPVETGSAQAPVFIQLQDVSASLPQSASQAYPLRPLRTSGVSFCITRLPQPR